MVRDLQQALDDGSLAAPPGGVDFLISGSDVTTVCHRQTLHRDCPVRTGNPSPSLPLKWDASS